MSLFSKILGNQNVQDKLREKIGDIAGQILDNDVVKAAAAASDKPAEPEPKEASVYDVRPAEENQFSFGGSYVDYFNKVFSEAFPAYRITNEPNGPRATVFTFFEGGKKALVVELMSERSSANKLRTACQKEGTPYLRYYYDHDGWWNTRSYVVERTGKALNA